jgi:lysophospholipase L1-like esterase
MTTLANWLDRRPSKWSYHSALVAMQTRPRLIQRRETEVMERLRQISRRCLIIAALTFASAASAQTLESGGPAWVATWSTAPMSDASNNGGSRSFDNQTLRQIMQISVGGSRVRVRISNEYGETPLLIGSAHVARQSTGASIVPGTDRALKFGGRSSVVIREGSVVLSDPVTLNVPSNASLALSLWLPQSTGLATFHMNGNQTAYVSGPGNFSDAIDFPTQETQTQRYYVTFIEVLPQKRVGALAIVGASITEGQTTTLDANRRVSDVLSRQLNPPGAPPRLAVLNQSTGCGRLIFEVCGPSGLSRFRRDALNATGVTHVLVDLGLGDIIFPTAVGIPGEIVSAEQIIAGLRQLIQQAHARDLKVSGATLTPVGASIFPNVFTPENEAKRLAVNHWMRTSNEFDVVVDLDKVLRDPNDPTRVRADYLVADGIHPNDAGHAAMARAIALALR